MATTLITPATQRVVDLAGTRAPIKVNATYKQGLNGKTGTVQDWARILLGRCKGNEEEAADCLVRAITTGAITPT